MKVRTIGVVMVIVSASLVSGVASTALGRTIYVDGDSSGANDGTDWENAYNFLQDALADANTTGETSAILVAEGWYRPDRSSATPAGSGDREATFQLIDGVTLRGGYSGFGGADPDLQNITLYQTVLSGDLAGNDADISDPRDLPDHASRSENSYHVLTASGTNATAVLEGFIVTGGNANSSTVSQAAFGGGMINIEGSCSIAYCTFRENSAGVTSLGGYGGAIDNENYAMPTITGCAFYRNYAVRTGGAISSYRSAPRFVSCTFKENRAYAGAAVENDRATGLAPTEFDRCRFVGNIADSYGGAMWNSSSFPDISNSLFEGNAAIDPEFGVGGAIANWSSETTLRNCTIVGNRAPRGGSAIANGAGYPSMMNCIIWDNPDGHTDIAISDSNVWIDSSCIEYGWTGNDNTDEDPLFARAGRWDSNGSEEDQSDDFWIEGDYHVRSISGRWDPNISTWVRDNVSSPCIDNAHEEDPVGDELVPNGWRANMGAYGGLAQASMSSCPSGLDADCYPDGIVNIVDLIVLSMRWLGQGHLTAEDINRDGIVDFDDLAIMQSQWQDRVSLPCSRLLLHDGFERGQWNGLWTQDAQDRWYITSDHVADANFSAEAMGIADEATLTSNPMDLQGMTHAKISFVWFINDETEIDDHIACDVSTDGGGTWQEKARFDGDSEFEGQWRQATITLKDISTLQLRFRFKVSAPTERVNLDLVTVEATYH